MRDGYVVCGVWCVVCGAWCVVCGVEEVRYTTSAHYTHAVQHRSLTTTTTYHEISNATYHEISNARLVLATRVFLSTRLVLVTRLFLSVVRGSYSGGLDLIPWFWSSKSFCRSVRPAVLETQFGASHASPRTCCAGALVPRDR